MGLGHVGARLSHDKPMKSLVTRGIGAGQAHAGNRFWPGVMTQCYPALPLQGR